MLISFKINAIDYVANLREPLDISIPLRASEENLTAWYVPAPRIEPVRMGDWVGDVNQGASVNFRNVFINPHGHGTHTECVGHISKENHTLNAHLKQFMFIAEVVSIEPAASGDDKVIMKDQLLKQVKHQGTEALIIRTLPNDHSKWNRKYSSTNPPYLHHEAAEWLVEKGISHLLIDTPSVDREEDGGKLLSHHAFWKYPGPVRTDCTITELIYVDEKISDGLYLLNLQITSLENDASPSKPVLYKLTTK